MYKKAFGIFYNDYEVHTFFVPDFQPNASMTRPVAPPSSGLAPTSPFCDFAAPSAFTMSADARGYESRES